MTADATARLPAVLPELTPDMLRRFDVPGPRYTSYPTADRFVGTFAEADFNAALTQRRASGSNAPFSLYVHIPFCESLCFYCACNKIITQDHKRAAEYLHHLDLEIALYVQKLGQGQPVSQLHFGGGTPTFMSDAELATLMSTLRRNFTLVPDGEYAIEVDPRTVDSARLQQLADLGFNRLSFGVQDFDPEVQEAVHRIQPAEKVFALVKAAREIGFASINVDLIYGLPRQTPQSFQRTLQQVIELRPDRIALYGYAHLPARFKSQRYIDRMEIPSGKEKLLMLSDAINTFLTKGYVYIGMDHFALPDDELAVARREGTLQRNFQGYSTQPDCDQISLGVSAIARVGATYSQNTKVLKDYYAIVEQGHLPIVRGLTLSQDDLLRRDVIMTLMCQGQLHYAAVNEAYQIDFEQYFADELAQLATLEQDGLVSVGPSGVAVSATGWFFVRAVAMVFDRYLRQTQDHSRFSRII